MFNLQSYSETGRDLPSIEYTSRATSWDSQTEANEWDPLPWGTCRGKSLSSCLPLQSITLQTVLLWEISTQRNKQPKLFSCVLQLRARCIAGKEWRRRVCHSIAYCGQAGTGSEKAGQEFNSSCRSPRKCVQWPCCVSQPFVIF